MAEAYCLKCKTTREVRNPRLVTQKNGRTALNGTCAVCGKTINRIVKTPTP